MRDKLGRFVKGHRAIGNYFKKGHNVPEKWRKKFRNRIKLLWQNPEYRKYISEISKGHIPWNKNTKGICKPTSGSFKKGQNAGEKNWNWKKGIKKSRGYICILNPSHPRADCQGYIKRAILVMEKIIGRFLEPQEVVHHKGTKYPMGSYEDKGDDRPKNLQLFANRSKHLKFHYSFRKRDRFGRFI